MIRQIIATISVLPFLDGVFTFDMLLYTDKNTALPSNKWEDAKPQYVATGEQQLKFPTVATGIKKIFSHFLLFCFIKLVYFINLQVYIMLGQWSLIKLIKMCL